MTAGARPAPPSPEDEVRMAARHKLQAEIDEGTRIFEQFDLLAESDLLGPDRQRYKVIQLLQALRSTVFLNEAPIRERAALEAWSLRTLEVKP